ncbi:MAG: SUMF1/EgtB/PvdO family nonheme iron enzyme [Labilithrix sp.]|nr:SUMF1/EgtB/PvdO family nonheme iron enzyme [Labilithrix sp.]
MRSVRNWVAAFVGGSLGACSAEAPEPTTANAEATPREETERGEGDAIPIRSATEPRPCGSAHGASCVVGRACGGDADCASGLCGRRGPNAGTCVSARSCTGAPGADRRCANGDDCCASTRVPAGLLEEPGGATAIAPFRLDAFEITVGRMRAYYTDIGADPATIEAQMIDACARDGHAPTWTATPGDDEDKPANCLDAITAAAFCAWDGGRLPTDAEWSWVAASGQELRVFPWGDEPSAVLERVGSQPGRSRWGHADIGSSVRELVSGANPEEAIVRGGEEREHVSMFDRSTAMGARCARDR